MALKKKITKSEYDKLSDGLKTEYVEDGDGYRLDIEGEEDTGALKRAKDRESQLRKDAEKRAKEAEDKLALIEGDDARKKGDIDTLEKAWNKKIEDANAAAQLKIDKLSNYTKTSLVDTVALGIATKISNSPALILPDDSPSRADTIRSLISFAAFLVNVTAKILEGCPPAKRIDRYRRVS